MPLAFLSFALRSVSGFQEVILGRFRSFNGVAAERFKNPKRFPMHAQWRHIFHFAPIHPRTYWIRQRLSKRISILDRALSGTLFGRVREDILERAGYVCRQISPHPWKSQTTPNLRRLVKWTRISCER
jgi:hypothetical protein